MTEPKLNVLLPYTDVEANFSIEAVAPTSEMDWGWKKINAGTAWDVTKGAGVVVCVLDTGVKKDHPDLAGQIIDGRNFTTDYAGDLNNYNDNNGHGTHVCGIIAAKNNGTGYTGIAPEAKLIVGKVFDSQAAMVTAQWLWDAMDWAINWRGPNGEKVDIINMSLRAYTTYASILHDKVRKAFDAGINVVVSAGNDGDGSSDTNEWQYPAGYPEVISVANMSGSGDGIYSTSDSNTAVDIAAPGTNIYSTTYDGSYGSKTGTSMAAPHVAGALALIRSAYKAAGQPLSATKAQEILFQTVRPITSVASIATAGKGYLDFSVKPLPKPNTLQPLKNIQEFLPLFPYEIQNAFNYIRPQELWKRGYFGNGATIAILSTGVETTHEALFGNVVIDGKNFTSDYAGNTTNYQDNNGIGTFCAGILASKKFYRGIAPHAKIIAGKVQKSDGTFNTADLIAGVNWAKDWRGPNGEKVNIVLITCNPTQNDALSSQLTTALDAINLNPTIIIAGAGDNGDNNTTTNENNFFFRHPFTTVVGSTATTIASNSFSTSLVDAIATNSASDLYQVHFCAPGQSVSGLNINNIYQSKSNTYVAATITAGAFALLMQAYSEVGITFDRGYKWRDEFLKKYVRPQMDKNKSVYGNGILDLSYGDLPVPIPNKTAPILTADTVYNKVVLSWDYASGVNDVYYQVKRDEVVIAETKWLQAFIDFTVTEDTSYVYKVAVMDKNGLVVESNELSVAVPKRSQKILSQIPVEFMRKELKIPAHVDVESIGLEANMSIAIDFIQKETFKTLEELDQEPLAVGVFKRLVADLHFNRTTEGDMKENPTYKNMLNRLRKQEWF